MAAETTTKVLILAEPDSEETLREKLGDIAGGGELELKIVAPIEPRSGLDLYTGDIDDSIAAADARADRSAAEAAAGADVEVAATEAGDADELLALEDALATFEADRIVLVDADEDLIADAQKRFDLPVSTLTSE